MNLTKIKGVIAAQSVRRWAKAAGWVVLLVILIAVIAYRTEIFRWKDRFPERELELLMLVLGAMLLIGIFVAVSWNLVQTQAAAKLMRSNLALSEARLKSLFQTIPDMIWLKNEQGVYLACNPAFERFFGSTEMEIVGKTDYDFVEKELADFFREKDRAALEAGEPRANEEWVTLADTRKRILLETIKAPVRTDAGDLVGVLGIARDITRRHEAEKEASLFRNLVEFSGDPIYVMDRTTYRMVFVNQAACDHFGATREEIAGLTVFDWDPQITEDAIQANTPLLEAGKNVHFETTHRRATGETIPVEVSVNQLSLRDGRRLAAGYIRNISERKKAEVALRQSHQQLLELTANIPGVVFQYQLRPDGSRNFPFISSTVEELYGLTPDAIYADPERLFRLVHPADADKLGRSIAESARIMLPWRCEFRISSPTQGERWQLGHSRPALREDGSIVWYGFITDITVIKEIEDSLRHYQKQLRDLLARQDRIREDERKRIAREIHDELGQYLLAMRIDVAMLAAQPSDLIDIDGQVENILTQIDGTMRKIRNIINNLRPSVLDLGLFAALEWQLKEFERQSGIGYDLIGNEEELDVSEPLATTLFRILQEALANVQHHANATRVRIDLHKNRDSLIMIVSDNGRSIPDQRPTSDDRFGLLGIRERIAMLGGNVIFKGLGGTVLTISLPLGLQPD